jgi:effector-binding domain-containing protein
VNKEDLRSEAGCIIEDRDEEKLGPVKEKFETKKLPVQKYMIAEFPYKGKGSVIISIMKVYPALVKFAREHGHNTDAPVMEIYDVPNKKIYYRKEL